MINKITNKNNELILRAIKPSDFNLLLEMDKNVYPTSFPVTREIIKNWYVRNPEFGMIYEKEGKIAGIMLIIPLNKESWKKLINGKLKESEMNNKTIFDNKKDKEIGLHIYHLEKIDKTIKEFYKICLKDINEKVSKLKIINPELRIVGLSALSVTSEGIGLFENKFNFTEKNFLVDEHILEKDNKKFVAYSQEEVDSKIKKGYKYLNKCKMLILYPNEESIVWDFFNNEDQ